MNWWHSIFRNDHDLQKYIGQRVQEELEKYNLKNNSEFSDLSDRVQRLQESKDSVSDKFIEELLEKLKDTEVYKNSVYHAIEKLCEDQNTTNTKRTSTMQRLLAGLKNVPGEGELDQDVFSMMMISISWNSWIEWILVWVYGIFAYGLQMTLGILVIMDQMGSEFGGTVLGIPIRGTPSLVVAKTLAIVLSVLTQTDFLMSFRSILILWEADSWNKLKDDATQNTNTNNSNNNNNNNNISKKYLWWIYIFLPNVLKGTQGLLILSASFVLIMQSENTVDLLKDYSALFVISEVDNLFFNVADMGYVGSILSDKADKVKDLKFEEEKKEEKHWKKLALALLLLFAIFMGNWIYIAVGQVDGRYVKQAYPICNFNETHNNIDDVAFLDIIGDNKCQYPKEEGTNVLECGWDGGDCVLFNERYPQCSVKDFTKLGDDICDDSTYNNRFCGFDNGDCVEKNMNLTKAYPNCNVENIGWIHDTICNGGDYASEECGNDGGDCAKCVVDDINLVGDGTCHGSSYNNEACSFDGGDCTDLNQLKQDGYPDCNVENIGWINDTICNGGDYASKECVNDGGDCANCVVDDINLVGDGTCDGSEYNNKACGFDGGDCTEINQKKQEKYPDCSLTTIGWTEDGFCDEINNVDGCAFDGKDCVPSMKLIGDKYDGDFKWTGGVFGHDGNIYGIPWNMNKILKIDPSANATNPTAFVGDDLGDVREKWLGEVVGNDGIIYGVPWDANSILSYNTTTEEKQLIAENHPLLESEGKFAGGVLAKNGTIYFIPFSYNKVIKFDPSNSKDPLTEIGDDLGSGGSNMFGGVLGSDGNIYGIPYNENRVLKINVANDTTSFLSDEYPDDRKWFNGILAQDGNIYACPYWANQILQINVQNQTTKLVGPHFTDTELKWSGFVEGEDGFLYGIPHRSNELLRFDPINHTATLIPLPEEMHGDVKWVGGVRAANGFIYAIPYWADQVLSIAPLKFRP